MVTPLQVSASLQLSALRHLSPTVDYQGLTPGSGERVFRNRIVRTVVHMMTWRYRAAAAVRHD